MQRRNNINGSDYSSDSKSNEKTHAGQEQKQPKMHHRTKKRYIQTFIRLLVVVVSVMYVLVPFIIYMFPWTLKSIIFLSFVKRPWFADYSNPESVGLEATRNFYINSEDGIQLGTWHVLPRSFVKESVSDSWYENSLKDGPPIVIYLHGNAGSRATRHRVELYNVLRELDAHVISVDYRGYGDSTSARVCETGIVNDANTVYKWVKHRAGKSRIFIWGHSLGTGVATHFVAELNKKGVDVNGLILEAPFNNMSEEAYLHPLSTFFNLVPWFRWAAHSALKDSDALFDSDQHINSVTVPIVILHAADDQIIPIHLGQKLYEVAVSSRSKTSHKVSFVTFPAEGLGHQHICRAANFPQIIKRFLERPEEKLS